MHHSVGSRQFDANLHAPFHPRRAISVTRPNASALCSLCVLEGPTESSARHHPDSRNSPTRNRAHSPPQRASAPPDHGPRGASPRRRSPSPARSAAAAATTRPSTSPTVRRPSPGRRHVNEVHSRAANKAHGSERSRTPTARPHTAHHTRRAQPVYERSRAAQAVAAHSCGTAPRGPRDRVQNGQESPRDHKQTTPQCPTWDSTLGSHHSTPRATGEHGSGRHRNGRTPQVAPRVLQVRQNVSLALNYVYYCAQCCLL